MSINNNLTLVGSHPIQQNIQNANLRMCTIINGHDNAQHSDIYNGYVPINNNNMMKDRPSMFFGNNCQFGNTSAYINPQMNISCMGIFLPNSIKLQTKEANPIQKSGKLTGSQSQIRHLLAQKIRISQRMRILAQSRQLYLNEEQQQLYYSQMQKLFFEEHMRQLEEQQLRKEYEAQQQEFYDMMYKEYIKDCENELPKYPDQQQKQIKQKSSDEKLQQMQDQNT